MGLNSWSSCGAPPATVGTAGLESFEIEVPSAAEQVRLAERLTAAAVPLSLTDGRLTLRDPWNIEVTVTHP
jgi:catechol-2,3-dioxygenase